ncbi:MAG: restriction endonuclease subunit S [Verrucomicrobia bacterium]|nr:restriction endonuclease subunit S [Verrucomicrobiota bacterium]
MSDALKPYPAYKESGQEWLGRVPQHWPVLPNRALFAEVKDRDHPDEEMLSVTITQGIIRQKALLTDSSKKDSSNQDKSNYKLVQPHDIAYNKMRAWQGAIGVSDLRGIISPAYIVMRLREEQNARYFHHLYRTPHFAKEAERWSYGITSDMWSLRPEHFKMIYSARPPRGEQDAIVRFLDHANGRMERLIRAKRRLIELLNEQKQAIIHRAVTGKDEVRRMQDENGHSSFRLQPSSLPKKPSGIPWLGDIPKHWELWQIGHFARIGNGSTPSRGNTAYWKNGTYPWLNSSSVNRNPIASANQFVTSLALQECHLPRVPAGSVLIAITGQGKTRGTAAVLSSEATINQHMAYITPRPKLTSADYLQLFLTAAYRELRRISDDAGSTKGALMCSEVSHFNVALPPVAEQAEIIVAVQRKTQNLETVIARADREIALIREYRTRLIADVVTGQLDVREAARHLPAEAEAPADTAGTAEFSDPDLAADETEPAVAEAK